ncbi:MAG TPA: Crp/Fnr family transcriptional regulator, partial [Allosphingosinicella sp.]|nr:Crp/Fnr family transcriptional regulator [Allosphingosinicella sp.]
MPAEFTDADAGRAIAALLLKLRVRDLVSEEEQEVLRASVAEIREHAAGRTIVRSGTTLSASTLLVDGIVCRYKDLADGQRQIMELHIAGDFVDLHGFLLKRLDHHVGAMTAVRIALVPHDALRGITETHPHLGRMLWFSTLLDAAIHREKILSIGRRSAHARIAHLLCELYVRLELVGLARNHRYELPLTQADLADATGLTSVHVNR